MKKNKEGKSIIQQMEESGLIPKDRQPYKNFDSEWALEVMSDLIAGRKEKEKDKKVMIFRIGCKTYGSRVVSSSPFTTDQLCNDPECDGCQREISLMNDAFNEIIKQNEE